MVVVLIILNLNKIQFGNQKIIPKAKISVQGPVYYKNSESNNKYNNSSINILINIYKVDKLSIL